MKFKLNKPKLKVYYWDICPHCRATLDFLKEKGVPFDALDIERQPPDVVKRVVDANGGVDWVVPTLEYGGKWRAGRRFDAGELSRDLKDWGLL
ncbi:MAG: glutaredoxin family protein [Candidatus Merdousia sp.]|nr:glutaredoxin family protein [Candidatus Merdousia sp.]